MEYWCDDHRIDLFNIFEMILGFLYTILMWSQILDWALIRKLLSDTSENIFRVKWSIDTFSKVRKFLYKTSRFHIKLWSGHNFAVFSQLESYVMN